MKKISFLVAICVAISTFFCGCTQSTDTDSGIMGVSVADVEDLESAIIGEWVFSAVEYPDGKIISFEEHCASQDLDIVQTQASYTFNEDRTVSKEIGVTEVDGTYEIDGASIKCVFLNEEIIMSYDVNKGFLTINDTDKGVKNIFIKLI